MKVASKETVSTEFGLFIREARERKGLYQADVAEKLGVSRVYYTYIETGKRDIYFTLAVKICQVLDLDLGDFMKRMN